MADQENANRALRLHLRALTEEARNNERVLQRFLERELELLGAESLGELLGVLTDGMLRSFSLDDVTLVLADPEHQTRHLLRHGGLPPEAFSRVLFVDALAHLGPALDGLARPRLGAWHSHLHAPLFPESEALGSVALLPLVRRRQTVGSLNLGSADPERFTHRLSSDFLARLGVIGALCLENAENRERLVISGITDPLTGLHNRRYLEQRLHEELTRAARYRQPLSCLFIDVDHFKQVNDRHGHATGDAVLREIAGCIRSRLRASDVATRYGGEEIAVLLPQTDTGEAMLLAERIREEVAALVTLDDGGEPVAVTVSVGVGTAPPPGRGEDMQPIGEGLLDRADQALYQAKGRGRNRVVCFGADPDGVRNVSSLHCNIGAQSPIGGPRRSTPS